MPVQYAGVTEEHKAVRTAAGLFDVCHMGELVLTGGDAGRVVNEHITSDTSRLVDGQALYTCACNERGGVLDDLIVYRVRDDRWLIVCNASNREKISRHFQEASKGRCEFEDASDRTALLALQGPRAFEILSRAGSQAAGLDSLGSFHFRDAVVANVPCTVSRTGYTGEDGVEIFCPWDAVTQVWDTLLGLGRDAGLQPIGLGARDTLRLEARLSLYGNELDEDTTPLEAGLGWCVKLEKPGFVGQAALKRQKAEGVRKLIAGFEMVGRGIARHGYPIVDANGASIGVVASGSPSPTLGRSIGLGFVPPALAKEGASISIDCRGRNIEAKVVKTPFYKRSK